MTILSQPHFERPTISPRQTGISVEAGPLSVGGLRSRERLAPPRHEYADAPSMRRLMTPDRRVLQYITYFDGDELFTELTDNTIEARAKQYYNKEIWKSDEIEDDPARGKNVEFVTLVTPAAGETPMCSLRKMHASTWDEVEKLPSIEKFDKEDALDPKAKPILKASLEEGNDVVEIMALFSNTTSFYDINALFGCSLAESIKKKETWVMGMVGPVHEGFVRSCGDIAVQTVGDAVPVKDGLARKEVMITPVIIEPIKVPEQMFRSIDEADAKGDQVSKKLMQARLREFTRYFNFNLTQYFGEDTAARLEELMK